jgi:hypothetical protein
MTSIDLKPLKKLDESEWAAHVGGFILFIGSIIFFLFMIGTFNN